MVVILSVTMSKISELRETEQWAMSTAIRRPNYISTVNIEDIAIREPSQAELLKITEYIMYH